MTSPALRAAATANGTGVGMVVDMAIICTPWTPPWTLRTVTMVRLGRSPWDISDGYHSSSEWQYGGSTGERRFPKFPKLFRSWRGRLRKVVDDGPATRSGGISGFERLRKNFGKLRKTDSEVSALMGRVFGWFRSSETTPNTSSSRA